MNKMTARTVLFCGLGALALAACTQPKIVLEPTKQVAQREVVRRNGQEYVRTALRSVDEQWPSDVVNVEWQGRGVSYELLGWYASAGLSPARLRLEQTLEQAEGGWKVIHQPVISRFAGKENAYVTGYNYRAQQRLSLPKNTDRFSIILKDLNGNAVVSKECRVVEQRCL